MTRWAPLTVNIVLVNALWALAVLGIGKPWWWVAPLLIPMSAALQLRWSPAPKPEAVLILAGAAAGAAIDAAAQLLGVFRAASSSTTEFVIVFLALWINFGTTLRPSLRWAWQRPLASALLGAVGGPLAYLTAARLGAIAPAEPEWRMYAWCAAQYALALPLWGAAALLTFARSPGSARPSFSSAPPRAPRTPAS